MAALVTVVIPTGPAHHPYVPSAVASVAWQTLRNQPVIVVNDAPEPLAVDGASVIQTGGGNGPARARNTGLSQVSTPFVVFLDADDYLLPDALALLLRRHIEHDQTYTYSQHYAASDGGRSHRSRPMYEYTQWRYEHFNLHPITALLPTDAVQAVGGFDEGAPGWEDWTLYLRLAMAGYCGAILDAPTFVYRTHLSGQHHIDNAGGADLQEQVRARYRNSEGRIAFMGCGCNGNGERARAAARQAVLGGAVPEQHMKQDVTIVEYIGSGDGKQTFRVPSGRTYSVSRSAARRYLSTATGLHESDVQALLDIGLFRRVQAPPPFVPPPSVQVSESPTQAPIVEPETDHLEDGEVVRPTPQRRKRAQEAQEA